jgi:hypothetical protein
MMVKGGLSVMVAGDDGVFPPSQGFSSLVSSLDWALVCAPPASFVVTGLVDPSLELLASGEEEDDF